MKILVSGAGIAGPAACYWFEKFGFKPTLIEKAATIRPGGQALDVRGVATHLARKMGIYEKLCAQRTRIASGRFVDRAGRLIHEEHGEKFGFRQDDEVEILRGEIIKILMESIATVPCNFNRFIVNIAQDEDGVTVELSDGKTERFDLVIGADGIYSQTRHLVFASDDYSLINLGAYLSTFTIPNYLNLQHTELACEADRKYVSINSDADDSKARVGLMFRSEQVLPNGRNRHAQMQFLRETFANFGWEMPTILAHMPQSEDFYFDAVCQVKMNSWTKGRIALVGDAGYCASPLSGQGNNLAFIGAYVLAGELKAADGDYAVAFQRYNDLMRPFVEANQQFGAWISETYLIEDDSLSALAEERTNEILAKIKKVSNGIILPEY